MADGELRLNLNDETVRRLQIAAEASGQSVDGFVADLISDRLDVDKFSEALIALEEYDRNGESYDAASEMAAFKSRVAVRTSAI